MPLTWTVSHPQRLVHATGHGGVGADDFRRFMESMRDQGLRPYAKLLDMRYAAVELRAADVRALAQTHVAGSAPAEPRGPTAIVLDAQSSLDATDLYGQRSRGTGRALAIFTDPEKALAWLNASLANTAVDSDS